MMTRRVSIMAGAFLAMSACSDSTATPPPGTSEVAESTNTATGPTVDQDDSGPLMNALLAWQSKNLRMEVNEMESDPTGGRTMHAEIRNESDAVTCAGRFGVDSPRMSFGALPPGAIGSTITSYPSGEAGLAAELYLECAVEWSDVPAMTGLSAQELGRIVDRYPAESAERSNVVFALRWSLAGTSVEVDVDRRLAVVVPVEEVPPPSIPR